MSAGYISIRKSIRWLPDEASEPTSTIVLTSPQRRFVDLRILRDAQRQGPKADEGATLPLDRLDWAIAGNSTSTPKPEKGADVSHSVFYHWIDSRTDKPEEATDAGDMFPQPDGTTLETGAMINPETGAMTDYEEVWMDTEADKSEMKQQCVVIRTEGGEGTRGMVVLLDNYCQGFFKDGDDMSCERWAWDRIRGWNMVFKMGNHELPLKNLCCNSIAFKEGDQIKMDGQVWVAVEVA